jgi:hypothetical protein
MSAQSFHRSDNFLVNRCKHFSIKIKRPHSEDFGECLLHLEKILVPYH